MRRTLDFIYGAALAGACLSMVAIATLVLVQVMGRVIDRTLSFIGLGRLGISIPSIAEMGGFLFVAAASLALAATFRAAVHVRVTLLVRFLGPRGNRLLASAVLVVALALACFATWFLGLQTLDAYTTGRVSYGLLRMPLWVPQAITSAGFGVFAIAIADELLTTLRGRDPAFRRAELDREKDAH